MKQLLLLFTLQVTPSLASRFNDSIDSSVLASNLCIYISYQYIGLLFAVYFHAQCCWWAPCDKTVSVVTA